jgi:hypothetical protein
MIVHAAAASAALASSSVICKNRPAAAPLALASSRAGTLGYARSSTGQQQLTCLRMRTQQLPLQHLPAAAAFPAAAFAAFCSDSYGHLTGCNSSNPLQEPGISTSTQNRPMPQVMCVVKSSQ